ncbi:MAG TPA: hypothetical protein VNS09_02730 [Solirubrobacter sp.]|nr:hypothetical protein [Solirubrobacter sp.]
MARDLIPPLSPAGRPAPDGTPHLIELPPDPPPAGAEPVADPGPSAFRNRFGFLLGALAGVCVAAVLALVVVIGTSGASQSDEGLAPNWSKWQPSDPDDINAAAGEIAKKVGAEYTHPNGQQLVLVTGERLPINVALQPATGPISVFGGTGVVYDLNGLGPGGSIKSGKPSANRLKVIHREALELALYTFRYMPDVDMVVTLLPPPPPAANAATSTLTGVAAAAADDTTKTALFYRPGDLKPQLEVPLGHTLAAKAPTVDTIGGPEEKTVETLTASNIFKWDLPDQQNLLVLSR